MSTGIEDQDALEDGPWVDGPEPPPPPLFEDDGEIAPHSSCRWFWQYVPRGVSPTKVGQTGCS